MKQTDKAKIDTNNENDSCETTVIVIDHSHEDAYYEMLEERVDVQFDKKAIWELRFRWLTLLGLAFGSLIIGFSLDSVSEIVSGIGRIITSSSVLLSGYFAIGGLGAALVHNGLFILLLLSIIYLNKVKLTGTIMASVFMPAGFAFFGMDILNVLPFILGVFLYSKYKERDFSAYIPIAFHLGALGPVFNVIAFHMDLPLYVSLPLATLCCVFIGFFTPPLAENCFSFHKGYTMYNIGFTTGFFAMLVFALMELFNYKLERQNLLISETIYP